MPTRIPSNPGPPQGRPLLWIAGGALFAVLATANAAGYRYGVSDQAFYLPVIMRALDPAAFPRDGTLIDAQGHLMLLDEVLAAVVRATGVSLELLSLVGYLVSLALLWTGIVLIGSRVYASPWATAALGAAFTMRHRISQTSANSFEPYFHPRMLAFGLGLLATASVLRRRPWLAIGLVAFTAVVHITTALWFALFLGVAIAVLDEKLRVLVAGGSIAAAVVLVWAALAGPLRGTLVSMDDLWLQAVASKDSLFATGWPAWAWAANLGMLAIVWGVHVWRRKRGDATREDAALVWGATALVALFLVTLPAVAAGLALVVQFQISRVFWLVDFVATVYLIAALATWRPRAPMIAALVLVAFAAARGAYIMLVEQPDRALFAVHVPDSPWENAMRWIAHQPVSVHVLTDPGHAWKYGTSVRVSARRDVLLEEVKDSALAIYSRDVALRFIERTTALGDFGSLTAEHALALARKYDLTYLVTPADLPLPLAYRNGQFRIYSLQ